MPFCYAPWTNIDIDPRGNINPCCKFEYRHYEFERHNIITSDLEGYKNSALLTQIKKDFVNDTWPKGCIRCQIEEENSVKSKRQLDYDRWYNYYDEYDISQPGFVTASIAFGNTCNLKCITCGPRDSSRWFKEHEVIYSESIKPNHFYKQNFVTDFVNSCEGLIHLDIPGGEPFLSGVDQQHQLLDHYIQSGKSSQISLHYVTNTTHFPDSKWWTRWQHFKEIDIQFSIDGVGSKFEYIRHPANFSECETNIKKYTQIQKQLENLRLSVSHTLSAYNVYYLDEFFSWCAGLNLPRPWIGRVHDPEHLRPSVFPKSVRESIALHLQQSKFKDVRSWADQLMQSDNSEFFDTFLQRTKKHDDYRQLDFNKTFPEVAELLATNNETK